MSSFGNWPWRRRGRLGSSDCCQAWRQSAIASAAALASSESDVDGTLIRRVTSGRSAGAPITRSAAAHAIGSLVKRHTGAGPVHALECFKISTRLRVIADESSAYGCVPGQVVVRLLPPTADSTFPPEQMCTFKVSAAALQQVDGETTAYTAPFQQPERTLTSSAMVAALPKASRGRKAPKLPTFPYVPGLEHLRLTTRSSASIASMSHIFFDRGLFNWLPHATFYVFVFPWLWDSKGNVLDEPLLIVTQGTSAAFERLPNGDLRPQAVKRNAGARRPFDEMGAMVGTHRPSESNLHSTNDIRVWLMWVEARPMQFAQGSGVQGASKLEREAFSKLLTHRYGADSYGSWNVTRSWSPPTGVGGAESHTMAWGQASTAKFLSDCSRWMGQAGQASRMNTPSEGMRLMLEHAGMSL
mmetsp:Transcript_12786/g.36884  ORF Transcript_12786/g.36884 Transcript_12786/m.36884 type:complete len:414 (+) Transcript_12786:244-1485(+)